MRALAAALSLPFAVAPAPDLAQGDALLHRFGPPKNYFSGRTLVTLNGRDGRGVPGRDAGGGGRMRTAAFALAALLLAGTAAAQDSQFSNPTPIDYTRPFLADGVAPLPSRQDQTLPVEVIGRDDLLRLGKPTMEELIKSPSGIGIVQFPNRRDSERRSGEGARPIPPAQPGCPSVQDGIVTTKPPEECARTTRTEARPAP